MVGWKEGGLWNKRSKDKREEQGDQRSAQINGIFYFGSVLFCVCVCVCEHVCMLACVEIPVDMHLHGPC